MTLKSQVYFILGQPNSAHSLRYIYIYFYDAECLHNFNMRLSSSICCVSRLFLLDQIRRTLSAALACIDRHHAGLLLKCENKQLVRLARRMEIIKRRSRHDDIIRLFFGYFSQLLEIGDRLVGVDFFSVRKKSKK